MRSKKKKKALVQQQDVVLRTFKCNITGLRVLVSKKHTWIIHLNTYHCTKLQACMYTCIYTLLRAWEPDSCLVLDRVYRVTDLGCASQWPARAFFLLHLRPLIFIPPQYISRRRPCCLSIFFLT